MPMSAPFHYVSVPPATLDPTLAIFSGGFRAAAQSLAFLPLQFS